MDNVTKLIFLIVFLLNGFHCYAQLNESWTNYYDIADSTIERMTAGSVVDNSGNIYRAVHEQTDSSLAIEKMDPCGTVLWKSYYNRGNGTGWERPTKIMLDPFGNLIIVGVTISISSQTDVLLLKYDSNGNKLWEKIYVKAGEDYPGDMKIDAFGNIYVIARIEATSQIFDCYILKYDSNGNLISDFVLSNGGVLIRLGNIQLDSSNNILFWFSSDVAGTTHYYIYKLDQSGNTLWYKDVTDHVISRILVNQNDNIIYAGGDGVMYTSYIMISGTPIIKKLDSSGNILWSKSFTSIGPYQEISDLISASNGSFYFSGTKRDAASGMSANYKSYLVKIDKDGNTSWTYNPFQTTSGISHYGINLAQKSNGELHLLTIIAPSGTSNFHDFSILHISTGGSLIDSIGHLEPEGQIQNISMSLDQLENVIVTCDVEPGWNYVFTIKFFSQDCMTNVNTINNSKGKMLLFPNPSNGKLIIDQQLSESEESTIIIYTLQGCKVFESKIVNASQQLDISNNLQNGVYLYNIYINDKLVDNNKLVIIK